MRKNKKAVSAIVATVLIIMITVAAVAIITPIIMHMVTSNLKSGNACMAAQTDVQIGVDTGFTCKNTTTKGTNSDHNNISNGTIKIQIKKGSAADVELTNLKLIVSAGGQSYPLNDTINASDLPSNNGQKVYTYPIENFTGAKGILAKNIDSVSVASIVKIGSTEKECPVSNPVPIGICA